MRPCSRAGSMVAGRSSTARCHCGAVRMSGLSYSPDLRHWGEHQLVLPAREGGWWDAGKIGLGPPPLETPEGWLIMYHGVHVTAGGALYRSGLALLDLEDASVVLHRQRRLGAEPDRAVRAGRGRGRRRLSRAVGYTTRRATCCVLTMAPPTRRSRSRRPTSARCWSTCGHAPFPPAGRNWISRRQGLDGGCACAPPRPARRASTRHLDSGSGRPIRGRHGRRPQPGWRPAARDRWRR